MFTGIVEEIGSLVSIQQVKSLGKRLTIKGRVVLEDVKLGDSIAVNGICLTVTDFTKDKFSVDVMPETLEHTNLGNLKANSPVNLERAMLAGGRFGGHIVSGHIDGTAVIVGKEELANAIIYTFQGSEELTKYMVQRGSVAIDGISLTLIMVSQDKFAISMIPHTKDITILGAKKVGDKVNIECDVLAKFVEKLLLNKSSSVYDADNSQNSNQNSKQNGISMEFLMSSGIL